MPSFTHPFVVWLAHTKFSELMVQSKWWWAFMMDMHFIGLSLLIGVIGALDLRMLGFAKDIPLAPMHKLVPFAIVGFVINLITGVLAFIGMPIFYTYDTAFWLKMFAILLAGVNVGVFYLTGVFRKVEGLGAGEDAPISAKLIAASSMFLWISVIMLGRYIQVFEDTISSGR
jgi:hypothetical protein